MPRQKVLCNVAQEERGLCVTCLRCGDKKIATSSDIDADFLLGCLRLTCPKEEDNWYVAVRGATDGKT